MKLLLLLACFIFVSAKASQKWISPDFFVDDHVSVTGFVEKNLARLEAEGVPEDCKARIKTLLCLRNETGRKNNTCSQGGERYASSFESLFDAYPAFLKQMFCYLDVINVEDDFAGSAYAGIDEDKQTGLKKVIMGVRKSLLEAPLSYGEWASWKEQLNFGGDPKKYGSSPLLPHYDSRAGASYNDFLFIVIAHEFAHIFDFADNINEESCMEGVDGKSRCLPKAQSWTALSWAHSIGTEEQRTYFAKDSDDFDGRAELCFYWCEGKRISGQKIPTLYRGLDRSSFMTAYGATNPWDDFADAFAIYVYSKFSPGLLSFKDGLGFEANLTKKARQGISFSEKRQFLNRLIYENGTLKYPARNY